MPNSPLRSSFSDDPPVARIRSLDPDVFDLHCAAYDVLPHCPFCGSSAMVMAQMNLDTKIIGYRVICTRDIECGASVHSNSMNRTEARERAIEKWKRRIQVS